ncbi:substrate-binding periplasmic protein [Shewanella sp.]|uniref:substrate-binding periplasmic protein n=1 Tax=Shewanella sp. TaxID=50422 RepID=UPI004053BDE8
MSKANIQLQPSPLWLTIIRQACVYTWLLLLGVSNYVHAQELKVGVSFSIPPYVIQETNSGIELELLRSALAVKGHSADIQYRPFARTFHEFKKAKLDAILNTKKGMLEGVFYSDIVIRFQNCAISLKRNKFALTKMNDMQGKSIVAFQRAANLLGDEFAQMAKNNQGYSEISQQILQVYMLMKHRTDLVIMDKNIFIYYLKKSYQTGKLSAKEVQQAAVCHNVFPPTTYRFAFLSEQIRDDFNFGLAQIKQDGTLLAIETKYQRLLSLTLDEDVVIQLAAPTN